MLHVAYQICFLRVKNLQAMKIYKYIILTQRGASLKQN